MNGTYVYVLEVPLLGSKHLVSIASGRRPQTEPWTESPVPVECIALRAVEDAAQEATALHQRFAAYRHSSGKDWFLLPEEAYHDLLAYFAEAQGR